MRAILGSRPSLQSEWTLPGLVILLTQTVQLQGTPCLPRAERQGCGRMLCSLTGLSQKDVRLAAGLTVLTSATGFKNPGAGDGFQLAGCLRVHSGSGGAHL